jgi:phosphoribosylformylglycinamidine synthase
MDVDAVRVCVLRIEGTNNEQEMYYAFKRLGSSPELVHLKQLIGMDVKPTEERCLFDYHILMLPGGFSSGDYVRAGAILAARMKSALKSDLIEFVEQGYPVGGICNGFQALVELGLLPAFYNTMSPVPEAALATNDSDRFECRPTLLKHENKGTCVFTSKLPEGKIIMNPSAHAEGKFLFPAEKQEEYYMRLLDNDQLVFRYVNERGEYAGYPYNPNGSLYNIAGICNPQGNVFGMMPHPERAFYRFMHPDWSRTSFYPPAGKGDGRAIFESVLDYVINTF